MSVRRRNGVPTKQELAAFNQELRVLKPPAVSPVRLSPASEISSSKPPVDLGIFPKPAVLTDQGKD